MSKSSMKEYPGVTLQEDRHSSKSSSDSLWNRAELADIFEIYSQYLQKEFGGVPHGSE